MVTFSNTDTVQTLTGTESSDQFLPYFDLFYDLGVADDDTLTGLGGTDEFHLTPGKDVIDGGDGWDIFSMSYQLYMTTDTKGGTVTGHRAYFDVASILVDLQAGTYDATLHEKTEGVELADVAVSGRLTSINQINAGSGDDTLLGSAGGYFQSSRNMFREDFSPGGGDDLIDGRGGFNALRYDGVRLAEFTQGVVIDVAAGTAADGQGGLDTFRNIQLFIGSYYSDTFTGDGGRQEFWGCGGGQDSFSGGGGTDLVYFDGYSVNGVLIDLATHTGHNERGDAVTLTGIEWVVGSGAGDTLRGAEFAETLNGGWGNDLLEGAAGQDNLIGSNGDDTLLGGDGTDVADYGAEYGSGGILVFLQDGTATDTYGAHDSLSGIENIVGSAQNDTIAGDQARNLLSAADGDDRASGGDGADVIFGGSGKDALFGNDGADRLSAEVGNDFADGGLGNDQLFGGNGNDRLFGGAGRDELTGGDGVDFLRDKQPGSPIAFWDQQAMEDRLWQGLPPQDAQLDALYGGAGKDVLDGHGLLFGGDADDVLTGLGYLDGGAGNDSLTEVGTPDMAAANSIMVGGEGHDMLTNGEVGLGGVAASYTYATSRVVVDLTRGTAKVSATDSDRLVNIGAILGTAFDDVVTSTTIAYGYVALGAGNDKVSASNAFSFAAILDNGDDIANYARIEHAEVYGGAGNDKITARNMLDGELAGGAGNDAISLIGKPDGVTDYSGDIFGGTGDDTITINEAGLTVVDCGTGNDVVVLKGNTPVVASGGNGSDTFVFMPKSAFSNGTRLHVEDFRFKAGEHDQIDLRALSLGLNFTQLAAQFEVVQHADGTTIALDLVFASNGKPNIHLELNLDSLADLRSGMFLL